MKRITILINKEKLNIYSNPCTLIDYICNYINYKLSPYKILGLFAYNTYPTDQCIIDGTLNPQLLIEHIIQKSHIINSSESSFILYSEDYNFFNTESGYFYLTADEYLKIRHSPQNYCIVFSDIYY